MQLSTSIISFIDLTFCISTLHVKLSEKICKRGFEEILSKSNKIFIIKNNKII
jgi:hypothetical protein